MTLQAIFAGVLAAVAAAAQPAAMSATVSMDAAFDTEIEQSAVKYAADVTALQTERLPGARTKLEEDKKALMAAVEKRAGAAAASAATQNSAARFALQAGDAAGAQALADKAVALATKQGDPGALAGAMMTRSMAHFAVQDYVGACKDAEEALKTAATDVTALQLKVLSCGRETGSLVTDAAQRVQGLLNQQSPLLPHTPEDWQAGQARAKSADYDSLNESMKARERGDHEGAVRAAESALLQAPGDPMVYAQMALLRNDGGDAAGTVNDVTHAIALGMKWDVLFGARARALLKMSQFKAALEDAEVAVALAPKDPSALATRAMAKMGIPRANPDEILADFKAAAELDPKTYGPMMDKAVADLAKRKAASSPAVAVSSGTPKFEFMNKIAASPNFKTGVLVFKLVLSAMMAVYVGAYLRWLIWTRRKMEEEEEA